MRNAALLFVVTLSVGTVCGQSNHPAKLNEPKDVTVLMGNAIDSAAIYRAFVENAPKEFDIPGAPRFAIVGKNESFYLGIGGVAKVTASFDFPNPINNGAFFKPVDIPVAKPGDGGLFQVNGQQTNIFFNVVAMPNSKNRLGFYFDVDLLGSGYTPSVHNAYLTYRGLVAGYNTTLFFDGKAVAPTIDKAGPNSSNYMAVPLIDFIHRFDSGIELGVGAEIGEKSFTNGGKTYTVNQRIPDIPAYIQFNSKTDPRTNLRIAVIGRDLQYYNEVKDKMKNVFGWGVKASGTLGLGRRFIVYYMGAYGKGIGSYFRDFQKQGLDLTPVEENNGELEATPMWGAYLGLQYNWSDRCFSTVTYSQVRNYAKNDGATDWTSNYRYGQYVAANIFYNITSQFRWGLEWDWGRHVDCGGASRHDNRIQTMLQFSF
ncbi:MAG: hypothetical protein J1E99_06935 [Muribaculaceae bacterium]|nr:hypothetical protein [Muribaculaceae bacterium]